MRNSNVILTSFVMAGMMMLGVRYFRNNVQRWPAQYGGTTVARAAFERDDVETPATDVEASVDVDAAVTEQTTLLSPVPDIISQDLKTLPETQRHSASLHPEMITPGNFEYLGAFLPPRGESKETTFSYGGWGIAYRDDGDPDGLEDGFPGSLYLVGHQQQQMIAEISIPAPVNSKYKNADDLPVSEFLQPFGDISHGLLKKMTNGSSEHFRLGGLHVTNGKMHWTMFKYYNVENIDYLSHCRSDLNLRSPAVEGPWHLGPVNSGNPEWNSYKHAGYIFEIPPAESTRWFGGRNLISGLQISTGLQASSQGPAMFAYSLPPSETPIGTSLSAVPLAWYSQELPMASHHPADRWTGGAWLTLGNKQAVVIAGRKSLGAFYYGEARPEDCTPDKGYHGPPYELELIFYSPASLIRTANGAMRPLGLAPWMRWDHKSEGGGPNQYMFNTCGQQVGGIAYDRQRNLLYLVQIDAGKTRDNEFESLPVIHVFRITDS